MKKNNSIFTNAIISRGPSLLSASRYATPGQKSDGLPSEIMRFLSNLLFRMRTKEAAPTHGWGKMLPRGDGQHSPQK